MLYAMRPLFRFYKKGYFVKKDNEISTGVVVPYKLMSELAKRYNQAISNFITSSRSITIVVGRKLNYERGDKFYMGGGDRIGDKTEWRIQNCFLVEFGKDEQSLRYVKDTVQSYWVLELL